MSPVMALENQLQYIVRNSNTKKVIPIHTENEPYYISLHDNVVNVTLNDSLEIKITFQPKTGDT